MNQPKLVSRWWYLVASLPVMIGTAVFGFQIAAMIGGTADMPRVVVPGQGDVSLAAGSHTVFGETQSTYHGVTYMASELSLRCKITEAASGASIAMTPPTGSATYTMGGFSGSSMFELTAPRAGVYHVACEGTGGPTTIAFGAGDMLGGILAMLASLGGGIVVTSIAWLGVLVLRRRARQMRPAPYFEVAK